MAPSPNWEFPSYTKTIHRSVYPAIDPKKPANSQAGKVVLITGGGTGVGKNTAKAFIEAGAKAVAILGRRENLLKETKAELDKIGSAKVLAIKADVLDEAALKAAFQQLEKEAGKTDIVIANAAYLPDIVPAAKADLKDWWKAFEVNIYGLLLLYRTWLPYKSSNNPTFINVSTSAGHGGPVSGFSGYATSKMAGNYLVSNLAVENPEIRISAFHPGVLASEMNTKSGAPASHDDMSLPSSFAVWLATPAAAWTQGKFLWAHWDVDELERMKDDILANGELTVEVKGWPKQGEPTVVP